jgi:RNA polymerase sigma factor (sigma-70 family)
MVEQEQLSAMLRNLAAGNQVAKRWSLKILGNRRLAHLHQVMQDKRSATRLRVSSDELEAIQRIPPADVTAIRATWEYAGVLWVQYEKMVRLMTKRFCTRVGLGEQEMPDLLGEATTAFLKSVRGYSDTRFEFSTYFCTAIKTELRRYIKRCRGLSGANEKLLIAYRAKWEELSTQGLDSSFDAVCAALNLSPVNREKLWGTLIEPTTEGDCAEPISKVVVDNSAQPVDSEFQEALGMVLNSLPELEQDSWISQEQVRGLFPSSSATMKEVAEQHGVSPQAAAFAAERANQKIERFLRKKGFSPVN